MVLNIKKDRSKRSIVYLISFNTNSDMVLYYNLYIRAAFILYLYNQDNIYIKLVKSKHIYMDFTPVNKFFLNYNFSSRNSFFDPKYFLNDLKYALYLIIHILKDYTLKKNIIIIFATPHYLNLFIAIILGILNLFLVLLEKPRVRLINDIHDYIPHPGYKSIFVHIYNYIIVKLSDYIILHCKKAIEKFKAVYGHVTVFYIPIGGFKLRPFHSYTHKKEKYVLFIGRLEKYKGLNVLYRIAKELPEVNFILAGKGSSPLLPLFKTLPNVTVYNKYLSEEEIDSLFSSAVCTVLPYSHMTQSGVILLSYSKLTPVISFNIGCADEYIVPLKTGFIVNSIEDFKERILLVYKNKELVEDIKKNIKRIYLQRFSSHKIILNIYNMLETVRVISGKF